MLNDNDSIQTKQMANTMTHKRILNIGSINIDHVYEMDHFVRPGETLKSSRYSIFAGGKGFNQSIALARAGVTTLHAGKVGHNAQWLIEHLQRDGVDTTHIQIDQVQTGHAMIQVIPSGENAIVLDSGANHCLTESEIDSALESCTAGDYLLLQNETNAVDYAINEAKKRHLRIAFNPAPMTTAVYHFPLNLVDILVLNETEAEQLTGTKDISKIRSIINTTYPDSTTVLTLGNQGAVCFDQSGVYSEPAINVKAVDTTAAGDTFIGFFLAEMMFTGNVGKALKQAVQASAYCVTKQGAADSIPLKTEIQV